MGIAIYREDDQRDDFYWAPPQAPAARRSVNIFVAFFVLCASLSVRLGALVPRVRSGRQGPACGPSAELDFPVPIEVENQKKWKIIGKKG